MRLNLRHIIFGGGALFPPQTEKGGMLSVGKNIPPRLGVMELSKYVSI